MFSTPMPQSNEQQKTTCVDFVLKEKHQVNPHLNLQLRRRKKKTSQQNKDVLDPENVLEPLDVDVEDGVLVKVVDKQVAEEVAEEGATGIRIGEDLLALVEADIAPRALDLVKDVFNQLEDFHQDPYQE